MQRAVVAVVHPLTDMAEAMAYLLTLRPRMAWSVVRAWWSFIKWHKRLSKKRSEVIRRAKVRNIYRGSIVLRYICGKRHFNDII